jgi:2-polyprenyl-6-methoxyphenol hydroxylase-like FAD-dependent oxidoreductase
MDDRFSSHASQLLRCVGAITHIEQRTPSEEETVDTTCVIVGGGPAGAMLGLLLARAGIDVTLLEKHADFLRDFRGDTIHPSTLQVLDEVGLADRFAALPHQEFDSMGEMADDATISRKVDFRRLPGRYRYMAMVPQWEFLNFLTTEAARHPHFHLHLSTEADTILRRDGEVRGVGCVGPDGVRREITAALTVAADGRHSRLRGLAGLTAEELAGEIDVVWFRLPREGTDPVESFLRPGTGQAAAVINRGTYWQIAYVVLKGQYDALRERGIEHFRSVVGQLLEFAADRTSTIRSFDEVSMLSVRIDRLRRWHRTGMLVIGDAAHAMSPIGGVGINLAVQDAVATANLVGRALRERQAAGPDAGVLPAALLARLQRRRQLPTAVVQRIQVALQKRLANRLVTAAKPSGRGRPPFVRHVAGRIIGLGLRPEHVRLAATPG